IFNDPIHGHIEMHPLCVKIIDTPQFQRLRYIKQLGCTFYVFPGAAHTRFEHSIGVGYLAWKLVKSIQSRQPELRITDVDVLCVSLAGLCHDLGHGILSHVFDNEFLPRVPKDVSKKNWKHEAGSVAMFEHMIKTNELEPEFKKYDLCDEDILFVKEQIFGPINQDAKLRVIISRGRGPEKRFLYEIVANKRNGIDVDKWDYFARDSHNLGVSISFDHRRSMHFVRAIKVNDEWQLCTRDKEVDNTYDMFYTRHMLHKRAYQHKTVKLIESMIVEALLIANDHLKFPGANGRMLKLSETINDMVAYTNVTDYVIQQIKLSTDPKLDDARKILQAVEKRQLYKCVGRTAPFSVAELNKTEDQIQNEIAACSKDLGDYCHVTSRDVHVRVINLNYGMKDENPIEHIRFYYKYDENRAIAFKKGEVSRMLPESFNEQYILVSSRNRDKEVINDVKRCFIEWCRRNNLPKPKVMLT
ncbi:uncharacterized protein TRIADDRAFT_18236, partial [Trichoplax adhaerens]